MLYTKMPGVPWYSIVMLLYIWLISLLMTIYIVKFEADDVWNCIFLELFCKKNISL